MRARVGVVVGCCAVLACGTPPAPSAVTLPPIDLDSGARAPVAVAEELDAGVALAPLACAAGAKWEGEPRDAPRAFHAAERAKLDELDRTRASDPSEATRDGAAFARARMFYEAHRWDEAAIAFREIAVGRPGGTTGPYAAQLYLDALNVLGSHGAPGCYEELRRDVPLLEGLYCGADAAVGNADLCRILPRIDLDIGRMESAKLPHPAAAERYLALFKTHCAAALQKRAGPEGTVCAELLYNAGVSYRAAGMPGRAADVLAQMRDPRYRLQGDPLTRRLACVLGTDAGSCP